MSSPEDNTNPPQLINTTQSIDTTLLGFYSSWERIILTETWHTETNLHAQLFFYEYKGDGQYEEIPLQKIFWYRDLFLKPQYILDPVPNRTPELSCKSGTYHLVQTEQFPNFPIPDKVTLSRYLYMINPQTKKLAWVNKTEDVGDAWYKYKERLEIKTLLYFRSPLNPNVIITIKDPRMLTYRIREAY